MTSRRPSRREFIEQSGLVVCGLLGGPGLLAGCEHHEVTPRISGALRRFITPVEGAAGDRFYVQFGFTRTDPQRPPSLSPEEWSLAITGAVAEPQTITFEDLMAAAAEHEIRFLKTMRCVFDAPGMPLISNGYWRGVPLHRFLSAAQPAAEAARVHILAEDGFSANLQLARALDEGTATGSAGSPLLPVTLVYELNGAPIPPVHGGPVRLVVPEKFGYKNVKFPREIEVTEADEPFGFYEVNLFEGSPLTDDGDIAITSFFSGPVEGEAVAGPEITFFGVAMNGPSGIATIEVSIDDGPFEAAEALALDAVLEDPLLAFGEDTPERRAELAELRESLAQVTDPTFATEDQPYIWVLWRHTASLSRGDHQARVRAFGRDGAEQMAVDAVPDDGNSQIRRVRFTVI